MITSYTNHTSIPDACLRAAPVSLNARPTVALSAVDVAIVRRFVDWRILTINKIILYVLLRHAYVCRLNYTKLVVRIFNNKHFINLFITKKVFFTPF